MGSELVKKELLIEVFDGEVFSTIIDHVDNNINGTLTIRSRFTDYSTAYFLLSITNGLALGTISIPEIGLLYSIQTGSTNRHTYLMQVNPAEIDYIEPGPPVLPPGTPEPDGERLQRIRQSIEKSGSEMVNIDVMVIYTPAANSWANDNNGSMANTIALAMGLAQLVLDNSETYMNMTLVHSAQVDYSESGDSGTDLYRLTFHEGYDPWGREGTPRYLEEVHDWREAYGADLVAFFTFVNDTGGLGWLLNSRYGRPGLGFSITRVQQAAYTYTHIHEMGHNMGAHHHKQQNVQSGPTSFYDWEDNNWSAGWRFQVSGQMYTTVMSYSWGGYYEDGINAARIPYFSNPDITYLDVPVGHAVDGNNTRTIREVRHAIASYMDEVVVATPEYRTLANMTLTDQDAGCFDATNTITTGGSGGAFIAQNGSDIVLVAGESILFTHDTHFQHGSQVHAYIAPGGPFCPVLMPASEILAATEGPLGEPLVASDDVNLPGAETVKASSFRVYPNPTTGLFTLEIDAAMGNENKKAEVLGLRGERILLQELPGDLTQHQLSLEDRLPGVYIIRVISGQYVSVGRIIKR